MDGIILPAGSEETLRSAADCIINGGIVAYPTETLYGLGARYDDESVLTRLYELKERPADKTMPLIIGTIADLALLADGVPESAAKIIAIFWPGPLTIVFRARKGLSGFVTRNSCVAVRMPGESFALDLARSVGMPITSTSANISGMPPARDVSTVTGYFGSSLDMIIDGGESPGDQPSTILDFTQKKLRILREGPISLAKILAALKQF